MRITVTRKVLFSRSAWMTIGIWIACLVCFIGMGIKQVNSNYYGYSACKNALEEEHESCDLAIKIHGSEIPFASAIESKPVLTKSMTESAISECIEYGYKKIRGKRNNLAYEKDHLVYMQRGIQTLSKTAKEILPGVLIVDISQTSSGTASSGTDGVTNRVACVGRVYESELVAYQKVQGIYKETEEIKEGLFDSLSSDVIPTNWPDEPYSLEPEKASYKEKILDIYNIFVRFGSSTLFAAIGLLLATLVCEEYKCRTLTGLYQASFVMGLMDLASFLTPDLLITVSLLCLPLTVFASLVASLCIRDFSLAWRQGFTALLPGSIIITGTKGILSVVLYGITYLLVRS